MSAICGIFNIDGRPISTKMGEAMMDKLSIYHSDKSETWYRAEVFIGCLAQHITPESTREKLPYFDAEAGLAITADAIIDNRNELFKLLNIPDNEWSDISDSQLILFSYKKWGEECPKYLVGDFAFIIYDIRKSEVFCARDHVGKRTFYFYHSSNFFAFCTVMKPLLVISDDMKKINDSWIADFLSLPGAAHEFDCNQTIYKDIHQLPPAHSMTVNSSGIKKQQYWFPLELPKLRLKSDEEYEVAFRNVLSEAVRCRLRSIGSVGVMLSGGLDSGSVACVAAKQLEERGQRLKAFTSIPFSKYNNWLPKTFAADERPYIEAISNEIKNIDFKYCRCEDKHSLTNVNRLIDMLEQPYKIIENLFWYDEIAENAANHGCSVLLDGQFGNFTISYGDFMTHIVSLFRSGKWISLLREIRGYSKLYNLRTLSVGKDIGYSLIPYNILKFITNIKRKKCDFEEMLPINPEFYSKWKVKERFQKEGWNQYPPKSYDLDEMRRQIMKPQAFSHIGALETKVSLAYSIAKRDPTKDKRVIEFCMSLPGEQFVRSGRERELVRRAMKGILPDQVRLNYRVRGKQSADWIQRIAPAWNETRNELQELLQRDNIKTYVDINKLNRVLSDIGDSLEERKWGEIRMLIISLILGKFLNDLHFERR